MRRRLLCLVASWVGGCWTEEPLIHDAFTAEQWAKLQEDYRPPVAPDPCEHLPSAAQDRPYDCEAAARFGQQLFFEPKLSGPWVKPDLGKPETWYPTAQTSCSTCHATTLANAAKDPAWYTDIRAGNAVSQGASNPTPHNTLSLVNVGVALAVDDDGQEVLRKWYGWTGEALNADKAIVDCNTPNDIVNKIALPKAMQSDAEIVGLAINKTPAYLAAYRDVFGQDAPTNAASIQQNVYVALGAYMRRLVSIEAPFDNFIRGKADAMSPSATRGFALFVGKAMCAECHRGSMFTDDDFHVTGVPDATLDKGRGGTGEFYTVTLRNIEKTGPYMHKGTFMNLGEVIDFYSRGGGAWGGYTGHLDPLLQPFELEPEEAEDLQAFLVALTGLAVAPELRVDTHHVPSVPRRVP
jgi:cytochrome c peroxidase